MSETVDLTGDSDEEAGPSSVKRQRTESLAAPQRLDPPLYLMRVRGIPAWANEGFLGAKLADIICSPPGGSMRWALISNFMLDFNWLVSACPGLRLAERLVVVYGERGLNELSLISQVAGHGLTARTTLHKPELPPFGCMHTKAFLVQYAQGLRVVVFTANAIYPDCNNKSEGLFTQDFPVKDSSSAASSLFEDELVAYVDRLRLPPTVSVATRAIIRLHDFSAARARLIGSVPGRHAGPALEMWGQKKLRAALAEETFPAAFAAAPVLAQFTSMGSHTVNWLTGTPHGNSQSFLKTLSAGQKAGGGELGPPAAGAAGLQLVWPAVEEVQNSLEGWFGGGSIPGKAANVNKPFLQPYYFKWDGSVCGRQRALPHMKTFLRYSGDEILWCLTTSHNLSKAAWGEIQNQGSQIFMRSFELGALLLPSLEAAYLRHRHRGFDATGRLPTLGPLPGADQGQRVRFVQWKRGEQQLPTVAADAITVPLPIPWALPPTRHGPGDAPWVTDAPWKGLDSKGRTSDNPYGSHYGMLEQMEWDDVFQ